MAERMGRDGLDARTLAGAAEIVARVHPRPEHPSHAKSRRHAKERLG